MYDPGCGLESQRVSLSLREQHWAPAQHCRCGLPCGFKYIILHVEDVSIPRGLAPYVDVERINVTDDTRQHHRGSRAPLWNSVVAQLNEITREEQRVLGYAPYKLAEARAD